MPKQWLSLGSTRRRANRARHPASRRRDSCRGAACRARRCIPPSAVLAVLLALGLAAAAPAGAQEEAPRDCEADFACFTSAGATCAPARVLRPMATEGQGILLVGSMLFELRGMQADRCVLYERTERAILRLADETVDQLLAAGFEEDQIRRQEEALSQAYGESVAGMDGTCRLPAAQLASLLQHLNDGDDIPFAEYQPYCEGPMFTAQSPP